MTVNPFTIHKPPAQKMKDIEWDRGLLRQYATSWLRDQTQEIVDAAVRSPWRKDNGGPLSFPPTLSGVIRALKMDDLIRIWMADRSYSAQATSIILCAMLGHYQPAPHTFGWSPITAMSPPGFADAIIKRCNDLQPNAPVTTPTTTKENTTMHTPMSTANQPSLLATLPTQMEAAVDGMLQPLGLPKSADLIMAWNEMERAKGIVEGAQKALEAQAKELEQLKSQPKGGGIKLEISPTLQHAQASGSWPAYTLTSRPASEVFNLPKTAEVQRAFAFELPYFEWEARCPDVPAVNESYVFRPELLRRTLMSLVTNARTWLTGHTGTGKTTLIEQVCARLGWPVIVINLDSEISRMDLMGRDVLSQVNGQTVTKFEEGALPRAMQLPCVLIFDEMDFGRSDVMYAVQRVLTGSSLTLTEDGGREIVPHAMFRLMATANTRGQGDEHGMYQGARVQSAALLDRFTRFIEVGYLKRDELLHVLKGASKLEPKLLDMVASYTMEHQRAFSERTVTTPFTPRGSIDLAKVLEINVGMLPAKAAIEDAMSQVVLDRLPAEDRQVLKGIADRLIVATK